MVSVKGPLEIESHGDTLALTSLKDITVQSTQGHLQLTAKNGITGLWRRLHSPDAAGRNPSSQPESAQF